MRLIDVDVAIEYFKPYLHTDEPIPADVVIEGLRSMPTLTPQNGTLMRGFDVVDTKTGEYPDLWEIALTEDWAKDLMYCDMEAFAIEEDGTLILLDECGRYAYCPEGRFEVRRPPERQEAMGGKEST